MLSKLWLKILGWLWNYPKSALFVFAVVTGLAAWSAKHLTLDTEMRSLLPDDAKSVQYIEDLEKRMGSTDLLVFTIENRDPLIAVRYQRQIAQEIQQWSRLTWVRYHNSQGFVDKHFLLYMPESELRDLRGRIRAQIVQGLAPYGLASRSELHSLPPPNLKGWPDSMALIRSGLPPGIVANIKSKVRRMEGSKDSSAEPELPKSVEGNILEWNESRGVWVALVVANFAVSATEMEFSERIHDKSHRLMNGLDSLKSTGTRVRVMGPYVQNTNNLLQIRRDVWVSGMAAAAGLCLLLWIYVRRLWTAWMLLLPVAMSSVWMLALAHLLYGRLTLLTSFVVALLSGLGIEYCIHYYSRWVHERGRGLSARLALLVATQKSLRSMLSAVVASIVCMLTLFAGHFKGFEEFGAVLSMGIACAFVACFGVLPALFSLSYRMGIWAQSKPLSWFNWLLPHGSRVRFGFSLPGRWWRSRLWIYPALILPVVIGVGFAVVKVDFENDFAQISSDKEDDRSIRRAYDLAEHSTSAVFLTEDAQQMSDVHSQMLKMQNSEPDKFWGGFLTIYSYAPAHADQDGRMRVIRQIRSDLNNPWLSYAKGAQKRKIHNLRKAASVEAFEIKDLPNNLQDMFREKDGNLGSVGYLYGLVNTDDAEQSAKFRKKYMQLRLEDQRLKTASGGYLYADVVEMVQEDAVRIGICVLLALCLIILLDERSWRGLLVHVGFVLLLTASVYVTMGLVGIKLGLFNLLVIPALLSNAVDGCVHLYHKAKELGSGQMDRVYGTAGSAVLVGSVANALGFGALCFAEHRGLQSIGVLAVLGYVLALLILFAIMPWWIHRLVPKKEMQ